MDILDSETVLAQLKSKEMALKAIDQKLAKELTRKQLLEEIYQNASAASSESSISNLSQSQISYDSTSSIDSSFLKKQIGKVYQYAGNQSLNPFSQTNLIHNEIDITKNTEHHNLYNDYKKKNEYSYHDFGQLQQTKCNEETTLELIPQNYRRTIKLQEEKRNREKQMLQFIQIKENNRQQQIQQERLNVRKQLLKEQTQKNTSIYEKSFPIKNPSIPQSNILRIQRTKALSHLLKQVQKAKRTTNRLLQKTHFFGYA